MASGLWAEAHGATTHFPIALVCCSGAVDALGFVLGERPAARGLNAAGYWTMLLGAAAVVPAVLSGVLMTRGSILGHGALRMHHLFVWPAFGLIVALAAWRWVVEGRTTRRMFAGYLAGVGVAIGLVLAAGYWGGQLALAQPST